VPFGDLAYGVDEVLELAEVRLQGDLVDIGGIQLREVAAYEPGDPPGGILRVRPAPSGVSQA
jgi:hypothetical protein